MSNEKLNLDLIYSRTHLLGMSALLSQCRYHCDNSELLQKELRNLRFCFYLAKNLRQLLQSDPKIYICYDYEQILCSYILSSYDRKTLWCRIILEMQQIFSCADISPDLEIKGKNHQLYHLVHFIVLVSIYSGNMPALFQIQVYCSNKNNAHMKKTFQYKLYNLNKKIFKQCVC